MTDTISCPSKPSDLGLSVPGDVWWVGQRESINLILSSFMSGKKFVIAAIPTGGGKTLIASAVQKLLARHSGSGDSSLVLTHTVQLQHQYQKTLEDAVVATGRRNHACDLSPDSPARIGTDKLTAEDAPCTEGACPEKFDTPDGCSYYQQKASVRRSSMVITNYAYGALLIPNNKDYQRELLICDECHLAEGAIQQAAGLKFWVGPLKAAGLSLPGLETRQEVLVGSTKHQQKKLYECVPVWINWAQTAWDKTAPLQRKANDEFKRLKDAGVTGTSVKQARTKWRSLVVLRDGLKKLATVSAAHEWIIKRDYNYQKQVVSITAQPLWGWTAANELLFKHSRRVLLMSATPGDPSVARIKLGIPKEECDYIERPSTFPKANRPVYFWNITKLNYQSSDAEWDKVAKAIGWIATRPAHLQRKGLVHSGSAANARRIVTLLNRYLGQRAYSHGDGQEFSREGALAEFIESPEPRILVTASFTTGLDLPDIIGWQVIAKVPFGSLGDEITARRREFRLDNGYAFGQDAYTADCANTVVQAAGRIVRHPQDTGPTFILDGNWELVRKTAYLPKFFLDAYQQFVVE